MTAGAPLRGATATVVVPAPVVTVWPALLSVLAVQSVATGAPASYRRLRGHVRELADLDGLSVCLRSGARSHNISVHLVPHGTECEVIVDAEPDDATIDWRRLRHRADYVRTRRLVRELASDLAGAVS